MSATAPARPRSETIRWLIHLAWIVPLCLLLLPTLGFLWHQWTESVWINGHGVMVPFLAGILAVNALRRHPVKEEAPSAWGFVILVPSLVLIALDSAIHTQLLAAAAFLMALPGLSLLLLGPERTRALLVPWLITFLMLPIPGAFLEPVHLILRKITITGVGFVLRALDLPVLIEGFYIYQPTGVLWVANECSGFSTLYASVTVAMVLAYLSESWGNRLLLLGISVPLAILCNIVRITGLALLVRLPNGAELLEGPLHPASGWATFMVAFGVLMWIADMRRWRTPEWSGSPAATSPTSPS